MVVVKDNLSGSIESLCQAYRIKAVNQDWLKNCIKRGEFIQPDNWDLVSDSGKLE